MFTTLLSTITGKITAGLLIAALFLVGFFYLENKSKERDLEKKESTINQQDIAISRLNDVVGNQSKTLQAIEAMQKVDEVTRAVIKGSTDAIINKDQTVSQISKKKIDVIENKYAALPATQDNVEKKDLEISHQRMMALSAVFCNSNPNDPACIKNADANEEAASAASASMH